MSLRISLKPIFLLCLCLAGPVGAEPYVPAADGQVLERLPFKPNDPVARSLARARAEWRRNPRNPEAAVNLARQYYELVSEEGDPRYLGYAQAALAPWWDLPEPPTEVQVMRASLRQFRHDFAGAIADLGKVLERDPRHMRARALRATIHIVQARYTDARTDCTALHGVTSELIAIACTAMIDGLTGRAGVAYQRLHAAFQAAPDASAPEKLWALLRLTEISQYLGRQEQAEGHFRQALNLGITDTFLLAAYADYLLDRNRPAEVVAMLKNRIPSDVLLLRLVLAERMVASPTAKERARVLEARYAAAKMRSDTVHQQEESRFALQVRHDPKEALLLAQENWKVQREPRDARVFLEAAVAMKDMQAAQPVLQWLEQNKTENPYLLDLAQQLRGGRK